MGARGSTSVAVVAALVGGLLSAPVVEAAPPARAGQDIPAKAHTVTLITGDRVTVAKQADTWEILDIEPARRLGADGGFLQHAGPDGVTVIPRSAVRLLRDGRLDDAFFDVTGLIAQGYDDAHTDETPLLVQASNKRVATTLGQVTRRLPAAGLTAVTAEKSAATFETISTHAGAKVWLNGKAFPTLDQSVPQVGAPEAWAAGQTGAGATIAVLDTGYDPGHPDLAGVVTGERDFLGLPSGIRDQVGHGTHVASTAAGRGTASGGKYTGVAKGADLMVGKVCDVGGCPFDAILAGMQWAAESGARVVNMSLGGGAGDGTDPVETELNRLSAEYGTLFVVAAGNSGTFEKVSSPASADAALAVASVSKQDELSEFSSRGPRAGDFALKPDIAAPGESIVAARATGTLPDEAVDEHHARLDGTSMATPHVAGAAAILAAQHPDWTGERIKAALMSTAHPVEAGVYEQGAGRLDVARAVDQPVTATPASLSLGFVRWPHDGPAPEPKTVTYRNTGSADVTLALSLDTWDDTGQPAPEGMFRAGETEVTVPAGGEAAVTVTFDPAAGPIGLYGGRLVATSGDTVVQTTVGGYKEPETYDLTLRMIDRNGVEIPAGSSAGVAVVQNLDNADIALFPVFSNEPVRLPAGRYAVVGTAETPVDGQVHPALTMLAAPDVTLDRDTAITMDARAGNKVGVRVDEPDARVAASTAGMLIDNDQVSAGYVVSDALDDLYAAPTTDSTEEFLYYTRAQVEKPLVRLTVSAPESFEVPVRWIPDSPTIEGDRPLAAVDVGHATPAELAAKDLSGKLAVFTLGAGEEGTFDARLRVIADAGAVAAFFHFSERIRITVRETPAIPAAYTLRPEGGRLAALGTASVTLSGIATSPYRYELAFPHPGRIPATVDYRPRNKDLATVRATYHAHVEGGVGYIDYSTEAYGVHIGSGLWSTVVPLPVERTEYYSPGPVTWGTSLRTAPSRDSGPEHGYHAADERYRSGERVSVAWNKAVVGPALAVDEPYENRPHLVYREGDTVTASLPLLSDAGRRSGFPSPEEYSFADKGDTSLYADGELVSSSGVPGFGEFTVPAGAADYRLVADVARDHPVWPLSTKVSAEWTFRSAHTDAATPLPLLTVGFDPKVDLLNHARAAKEVTIPVTLDRQRGARGGKPDLDAVEVSADDGKTWQRVRPRKKGDHWVVTVRNPEAGFVSLRASASDSAGNTVTETIIRAYRVR